MRQAQGGLANAQLDGEPAAVAVTLAHPCAADQDIAACGLDGQEAAVYVQGEMNRLDIGIAQDNVAVLEGADSNGRAFKRNDDASMGAVQHVELEKRGADGEWQGALRSDHRQSSLDVGKNERVAPRATRQRISSADAAWRHRARTSSRW